MVEEWWLWVVNEYVRIQVPLGQGIYTSPYRGPAQSPDPASYEIDTTIFLGDK
jgi:hypothetical protein